MCGICGHEAYENAALYFTFNEMNNRKIHAKHGGFETDFIPPGVYIDPIGRSGGALYINQSGCVLIGTFEGQCLSDPGQCTAGVTLSLFFNIQVTSTSSITILTTGAHTSSRGVYLGYIPSKDTFEMKLKTSNTTYETEIPGRVVDLTRTLLIPLTFTWAPASDLKVYIRGRLWRTIAGVDGPDTDTYKQFKIGCQDRGGEWSGSLKIDELAVWPRVMSDTEISQLSNPGTSHNDRSSSKEAAYQSLSEIHEQITPRMNVTKTTSLFTALNATLSVERLDNNSINDVTSVFSRLSSTTLEGTDCDDTVNLISTVSDIVNSLLRPDNHEAWEEFSETEPTALPSLVQAVDTVLEKITDHLLDSDSSINVHHVRDNFEVTVKTGIRNDEVLNLVPNSSMTLTSMTSPEVALVSNVFRGIGEIFPVEHNITWSEYNVESKIELSDHIVGVSLYPSNGSTSKRFNMTFPLTRNENVTKFLKCVYLDFLSSDQSEAYWSDRGCITDVNDDDVTCSCDHLTNFAILMQIIPVQLSSEDQHALGVITFLGCTLSLLGAVLTVLTFLFLKIQTDRVLIHLNLAVSIIGSQILLLVEEAVQRGSTACAAVAVLLIYFNLCVFTWMLVEGVQLFLQIVIVFTAESRMKLFYAIGWGLPFILCGIIAPIFHKSLGQHGVCWLSPLDNSIWAFVVPALLVIATNLVILIAVMRVILTLTVAMDDKRIRSIKTAVKSSILLLPLLGCTWLFGVMTVSSRTMLFQYIFAATSSFQGLFIFICHCVYNSEVRDVFLRRKSTWDVSRHLKTHSKVEPLTNIRPSSFKARPEMKARPPERVLTPPTGSSLIGSVPESENSKPCCQNANVY